MPVPVLHSSNLHFSLAEGIDKTMLQSFLQNVILNFTVRGFLLFFFCALLIPKIAIAQQPTLNLMPMPASVQAGTGSLRIDSSFSVALTGHTEPRLNRGVERFLEHLKRQTALLVSSKPAKSAQATLFIHTDHPSKEVQEVGEDESYVLEVTSTGAKLTAPTPLGTLHGLQTFLQLVDVSSDGFAAPSVTIQDKPRFPWRGLMIDSARHFTPLDVIRRNLDGMEALKLNVFHWHLTDNQGFRVESKRFPKLHELGSGGLYYTQDEVRDVIAYARDRGIRVVPEIEMPGHSTAIFVGYPEIASTPGPFKIDEEWGVLDPAMDPTNEQTYKFLDPFIGEMAKLFPDHFFHIGGDEVNGKAWDASAKIQEFKKAHGYKSNEDLQGYFSTRVQKLVTKHGKAAIGWDEIFVPGAPKDIVIHSWRGPDSLAAAAKQGYRGILSNGYYIDLMWSAARHYAVDPLGGAAADLTPEQKQLVLGGEATMWSEFVNWENIDSRIWPRTAAIAERYWSPQSVTDVNSMYARLDVISQRLEWLGITHRSQYRKMLQRIAGTATPEEFAALKAFADILEPVKDYTRGDSTSWKAITTSPLNHLVDAVPPESDAARHFGELVDKFISTSCLDTDSGERLRAQFTLWRDNDAKLRPLAQRSFLVQEAAGKSQDLSMLGAMGLATLDVTAKRQPAPDSWKAQQLATIEQLKKPQAQLLLVPVAPVQKLIEVAGASGTCAGGK